MTDRTNLPSTIPFLLLLLNLGNLWNFDQINFCAVRFFISRSSSSIQFKKLQGGQIHKIQRH